MGVCEKRKRRILTLHCRPAFSLIEVLIVVIILAILAGFAIPGYQGARQRALDDEAEAMLRLIRAAERAYELERGAYTACGSTAVCNTSLNLDLPVSNAHWGYSVTVAGGIFTGQAAHGGAGWRIDVSGAITSF